MTSRHLVFRRHNNLALHALLHHSYQLACELGLNSVRGFNMVLHVLHAAKENPVKNQAHSKLLNKTTVTSSSLSTNCWFSGISTHPSARARVVIAPEAPDSRSEERRVGQEC